MTTTTTTQIRHLDMPIPGYACKVNYITNRNGTTKVGEVTCQFCLQVQIEKFEQLEHDGFGGPKTKESLMVLKQVLTRIT